MKQRIVFAMLVLFIILTVSALVISYWAIYNANDRLYKTVDSLGRQLNSQDLDKVYVNLNYAEIMLGQGMRSLRVLGGSFLLSVLLVLHLYREMLIGKGRPKCGNPVLHTGP